MEVTSSATLKNKTGFLDSFRQNIIVRRFLSNRMAVTGCILLSIIFLLALFAPLLATQPPLEMKVTDRLKAPSAAHWFGTDEFGRDVYSRVVHGSRISIAVGLSVVLISSAFGMVLGLYSSYYRQLDNLIMRVVDGLMAFPAVLLAIAIMAALGPKIENVIISISVVYIPTVARTVRSAALVVREQTYIEAIRALGGRPWRIIWRHIAPNCMSPLIVQATFIFAYAVIIEASLSFLGAGTPPPQPSWGNILSDGRTLIRQAWWIMVFPGIAIVMTVLGLNLIGDGLRDLLDPHTNKAKN